MTKFAEQLRQGADQAWELLSDGNASPRAHRRKKHCRRSQAEPSWRPTCSTTPMI